MSDPTWLATARQEIGVREKIGRGSNPRITDYFQATGYEHRLKDDSVPWCSAFMNWVMKEAGYNGTLSLAARSWMAWGRPIKPRIGAVLVFKRGKEPWQGHVGLHAGEEGDFYLVLGGNQGDAVSIERYAKHRLLGARWPTSSLATSRVVQAQSVSIGASAVGLVSEGVTQFQPLATQAAQWVDWMQFVAFGLAITAALCTVYFKWVSIKDGKG
jgi:uncharacterized protein (TIGR02594 family)